MAEKAKQNEVEMAPDPDEDDLDDLDDVLDQFQARPSQASPSASASASHPPAAAAAAAAASADPTSRAKDADAAAAAEPGEDEDFAKQLQAGMQNLMGELGENPEMQRQFEEMMQELIRAGAAPDDKKAGEHLRHAADEAGKVGAAEAGETGAGTSASRAGEDGNKQGTGRKAGAGVGGTGAGGDFNDTIRRTMERMQASGDAATAASTSGAAGGGGGSEEDLLAQMMKELQSGGGVGGEEDFNKMLMSMMSQLTNKEILYEPMKELDDKFPDWLRRHEDAADVEKGEMERYKEQRRLVREIVARFERKEYRDENEEDREYIVDRMQKMQAQGSPPPDLVGDMSAAQEALGDLDQGCPQQ
ncbi:hypothetical protein KC332_g15777 [Hortaea werneckii]|uniref:Pex19-domain-containing protein n=1 Tax=Hortaea werneckii EXF-2000 TaxID=1157616 RepID=A0A1Z5SRY3_HORWE|nr:hypothetical protein KC350_g15543 [Hortaea werneckii]OTA23595.1 hypothetical protein BTJ68_13220 [Hortaea werneckii EXF-2000]KAI6847023.1 hypothetical protein KC358_g2551 [Hortaea werneckii]KAI6903117.1 hypothetical protein KC348_g15799 [Hortaea werneckii]KAI6932232.1 hypothetical protein KC341_g9105 [Hortaea werneckii]